MTRDDPEFLGRWSARKREARARQAEASAMPETPAAESADPPPTEPAPEKSDAEILEELGLPDPDTLTRGDDFAPFMRSAVPAALRNRALRRLWRTDAVFANLDGLLEYGQDYTGSAATVEKLKTAYRIGRGFLTDDEAVADSGPEAEPAPGESAELAAGLPEETFETDAPAVADPGADDPDQTADPTPVAESRPRRMRFSFGES